jgi:hypothetical protein
VQPREALRELGAEQLDRGGLRLLGRGLRVEPAQRALLVRFFLGLRIRPARCKAPGRLRVLTA